MCNGVCVSASNAGYQLRHRIRECGSVWRLVTTGHVQRNGIARSAGYSHKETRLKRRISNLCNFRRHIAVAGIPELLDCASAAPRSADSAFLKDFFETGARMTRASSNVMKSLVSPGDTVCDATVGRGFDTLQLAELVGPGGTVIGLDVQEEAVVSTRHRLEEHFAAGQAPDLHLHVKCHSRLKEALAGFPPPKFICFNLGFLPLSPDKSIKTEVSTTVLALQAAHDSIAEGGCICVLAYVGHEGGQEEYDGCRNFFKQCDSLMWATSETQLLNRPTAPHLLLNYKFAGRSKQQPITSLVDT